MTVEIINHLRQEFLDNLQRLDSQVKELIITNLTMEKRIISLEMELDFLKKEMAERDRPHHRPPPNQPY